MSTPASAEIIAIGTELLLGEIVDTNSAYIARQLREIGLNLFRTTVVGDNRDRISEAVRSALGRAQVVIATGGLGPTGDDVTREGIAGALGVDLEFKEELWSAIQARFVSFGVQATENNRRQAFLPAGSRALHNPVGTAPGFMNFEGERLIAALPGVPGEMQYLLEQEVIPAVVEKYQLGDVIQSRLIRTAGVGESWLDERIGDLQAGSNPTIGLAAHPGRVDIRVTAKAPTGAQAEAMIEVLAAEIRERVAEHIYAEGQLDLEQVLLDRLQASGHSLLVVEGGTGAELARALANSGGGFDRAIVLPAGLPWEDILAASDERPGRSHPGMVLVVRLETSKRERTLEGRISYRGVEELVTRRFRGQSVNSEQWAASMVLVAALKLVDRTGDVDPGTDRP